MGYIRIPRKELTVFVMLQRLVGVIAFAALGSAVGFLLITGVTLLLPGSSNASSDPVHQPVTAN